MTKLRFERFVIRAYLAASIFSMCMVLPSAESMPEILTFWPADGSAKFCCLSRSTSLS